MSPRVLPMRPRRLSACSKAAISAKRLSRWARPSRDRNDRLAPLRPSPTRGGWNQSVRSRTEGSGSMSFETEVRIAKIDEDRRSEEHTSELQSLMRISYAVFCLKKKKTTSAIIRIQSAYEPRLQHLNNSDSQNERR